MAVVSSRGSSRPGKGLKKAWQGGQDGAHFLFGLIEIQYRGRGDKTGATELSTRSSSDDKTHVKTQHPPARLHIESSCWEPTPLGVVGGWVERGGGGVSFLPKFNPCVDRTFASLQDNRFACSTECVRVCTPEKGKRGRRRGERRTNQGLACRDGRRVWQICEAPLQLRYLKLIHRAPADPCSGGGW